MEKKEKQTIRPIQGTKKTKYELEMSGMVPKTPKISKRLLMENKCWFDYDQKGQSSGTWTDWLLTSIFIPNTQSANNVDRYAMQRKLEVSASRFSRSSGLIDRLRFTLEKHKGTRFKKPISVYVRAVRYSQYGVIKYFHHGPTGYHICEL